MVEKEAKSELNFLKLRDIRRITVLKFVGKFEIEQEPLLQI